jgi:O-antigen ligase
LAALTVPHKYAGVELHSVGHVNHSAGIHRDQHRSGAGGAGQLLVTLSVRDRMLALGALIVFGVAIVLAGSRAATVVSLAIVYLIGAVWSRRSKACCWRWRSRWRYLRAGIQTSTRTCTQERTGQGEPALDAERTLLRCGIRRWQRGAPIHGSASGMDNFDEIGQEQVKGWVEQRGDTYDPAIYAGSSHAHSLYLTTLAERGLTGFTVILTVLLAWGLTLLRNLPRSK